MHNNEEENEIYIDDSIPVIPQEYLDMSLEELEEELKKSIQEDLKKALKE